MKIKIFILILMANIFFLAGCKSSEKLEQDKKILNVYNYGDYIDEDVLKIFIEYLNILFAIMICSQPVKTPTQKLKTVVQIMMS